MSVPNITQFISVAGQRDFARNNLFRVQAFKVPGILELDETDLVYCKGAQLPGRTTPTATVSYHGMKMNYNQSTVEYPGAESYTLEFYLDKDSALRQKFELASRAVFDDANTSGNWAFPKPENIITIQQLAFDMTPHLSYNLVGVAVKGIEAIETDIAGGDGSALNVKITISFIYYTIGKAQG